jgi:tetratricopeptide (TPR) repeat protein
MSAHLITALMLSLAVSLGTGCDWSSPEAKKAKHRERAASYFEKGQYNEAIIEYANVVKIDPKDADAYYRLALSHLKVGEHTSLQQAYVALSRAVELDKTNRDAQLKLGEIYLLGNEPTKAREQAEIILVSTPQNQEGLILKGRSLMNEKRYQEAIVELKKAIEVEPKNMGTYIELARAYMFSGNPDAAEATLKQALSVDPHSIEILFALADFHLTRGKPDQAELIYKQALESSPQNEQVYYRQASLYQRLSKWPEVEATLQKLITLKPTDEKPHIYLGDFFAWLGQPEKALASYLRGTEVNPGSLAARDKLISYYLDIGKMNEAEPKIKEILGKNNRDLMGRFFEARIQLIKNHPDEAIPILQGVIKDEPKMALAHHLLGVAFLQKRQTGQARAAFTEAVKLNPNSSESRTALAQMHLTEGSTDLAIEEAQAAIELNSRNIQAAVIAGDAYLKKGDVAKSKQVFEAMAKALPNEPIASYRLGLVAQAEKNDTKALAYFEEALKKRPGAIEPITQIAAIKMAQGKSSEARERVTKQLEASPNNPQLYNLLGLVWANANDIGPAEEAFKKAIELDNSLLSAYMNLAKVYHKTGKLDQAVKEYETLLVKDPTIIQVNMLLGMIYESQKQYDKAMARFETILKTNPKFAPAANNLAWLMVEHGGNLDVALSHAQTAREQQPEDPHIADTLGWVYYKKNAYLLAVSLLKEATEKLPNDPVVQYHYGMAQYKNGDKAGAKRALQTSLKLSKDFSGSDEAQKTLAGL